MKQLSEYIVVLEKVLPEVTIQSIEREYLNSDDWITARTRGGENTEVRNCSTIGMSFSSVITKNKIIRTNIDAELHVATQKIVARYRGKFPKLEIERDTGYDLLKYEPGGFYKEHVDSFLEMPRTLSCSIALNDEYEGGEFAFFNRELKYKVPKGGAILFPSNFMYPHEVMPVTNGTRYSIITWFR